MSDDHVIPQLETLDATLDDLESPTTLETFRATLPWDADMVAAAAAQRAINGGGGGGGSFPTYTQLEEPDASNGDSWLRPAGEYPDSFGAGLFFRVDGAWVPSAPVVLDSEGRVLGVVTVGGDGNIVLERFVRDGDGNITETYGIMVSQWGGVQVFSNEHNIRVDADGVGIDNVLINPAGGEEGDVLTKNGDGVLVLAAPSGGSQPIDSIGAENSDGTLVLPQDTVTDIDALTVDYQYGDGVTLGGDGKTFTLAAGVYQITAQARLNGGVDTATLKIRSPTLPASGSFFAANLPLSSDLTACASGTFVLDSSTPVVFQVRPTGGSGDDSLNYFGVDIVRLGDSAAAA